MRDEAVADAHEAITIDPATYVAMFEGRQPVPAAFKGVCGRIVRGKSEAEFTMLSFAKGRRLAWITGPDGLRGMIGRTGTQNVLGMGKQTTPTWLTEKLAEGMRWKLIVLPQALCARADWAGVFTMIEVHYPEVAAKFARWQDAVQDPALTASIDPALVTGAVKDYPEHSAHISEERYKTCPDTATNARLFLWHTLGLNSAFVGDGWATDSDTKERVEEYLTGNVPLSTVTGHRMIDLHVAA